MSPEKRISVVMITHNRRQEVLHSLDMFRRLPEAPHLIVVDNASKDQTAEAIRERFPEVELVRLPSNGGTAARNVGVALARTQYVALADDDVYWEPGSISRAADLLDAHPQLGVVVGKVLIGEQNERDPVCDELENSPIARQPGMPGPALAGFLAGASAIRRSAFQAAGGFPSWAFMGGEEEMLALDLAIAGWWICFVPEVVVHHFPSEMRDSRTREVNVMRNRLWIAWMRRSLSLALSRTMELGWHSIGNRQARRALGQALLGLPRILRQRRCVPSEIERQLELLDGPRRGADPKSQCRVQPTVD